MREITGDLVLDRSFFAIDNHDPAQFDNEPTRPYNVGADALLLNFKSFRLRFVPDEEKHTVAVYSEPILPQITVVNNLYLAPGFCDVWPDKPAHDGNTLTFFGTFPSSCGEKSRNFSLLTPNEYMAAVFGQMWLQAGGVWSGRVREAAVPINARLLSSWESRGAGGKHSRHQQVQQQRHGPQCFPDARRAGRQACHAGEVGSRGQ